ncbi:PREDICTED: uncharacterized protein LOC107187163 [Dufourea novaeangliae]|uniref:Sarcoplasmic calcium-binding proteins II, V, VI, and VII n=1 Tax=Dufourea novaeangliae TaxID=178035 RepID=A0A154PB34_DUFNO|nr:PREDICTED: uncharacterized protein LOC107187163 [Dufourea novaeangliae]KZC09062.1 hypothetical protein WN55_11525 [Dufourea novaeangliae]
MESRSDSIKDPIYYPSMQEALSTESAGTTVEPEPSERSRSSVGSQDLGLEESSALKVPRKFIVNWRQACDRTRDRTKDLLKRWRTVSANVDEVVGVPVTNKQPDHPGWSVHVWTTWVSRYPSGESLAAIEEIGASKGGNIRDLAVIQRDKFSHFFTYLLDHDKDGFINRKDFRMLSERLRRFADWSWNGSEYLRLMEAEQGLAELILDEKQYELEGGKKISLEEWLSWWARIVAPPGGAAYSDMPFWLKILPRIFFLAINQSANGIISKKELASFYGSVVGFDLERISKGLDIAYNSMTSNGDHPLGWPQYQLVFANFLFGRGPFGPGEHFLGMTDNCMIRGNNVPFPIDYSAMNTPKDKLEVYSPHCRSARRSVVV